MQVIFVLLFLWTAKLKWLRNFHAAKVSYNKVIDDNVNIGKLQIHANTTNPSFLCKKGERSWGRGWQIIFLRKHFREKSLGMRLLVYREKNFPYYIDSESRNNETYEIW